MAESAEEMGAEVRIVVGLGGVAERGVCRLSGRLADRSPALVACHLGGLLGARIGQ
ncbi:hypothetical protein [Streptomyces himalayensis]|uniref:Uncharacterized protein n=1 Tax=Streptomyces himalayensis subsp. himalayensis TaxID=2756131 RepID=A0A7W0ICG8_9ACTN|nr:hypothetical protein [Streptomyces himalayensis]MBA2950136.1 hypothetical protein [Streptomyces himalayensis subsp. himalayensis]